jgi:outer membrane protein assembly factor BamA
MPRQLVLIICSVVSLALAQVASAQQFKPKSIQFIGDPEFSDAELLAASGLKTGVVLAYADMNDHAKRLQDTGMFASLAFKFDGQDLIFTLSPIDQLFPVRLVNLPLTPGKELDAQLHDVVPLYHGKLPSDGGVVEDVRAALEKLLAARGVTAKVIATPATMQANGKEAVVAFSITEPQVQIGDVQLSGVSDQFSSAMRERVKKAAELPFDTTTSSASLAHEVEVFYQDRGFEAVKVEATQTGNPVVASNGIEVPFTVAVTEGRQYTIGSITLPAGAPVTQAEIDKIMTAQTQTPQGVRVRSVWQLVSTRYRAQGFMDCKVTPQPTFNDTAGTVNYTAEVNPGQVYHLGFMKFDNVSDQLRSLLMRYWTMMPGDVFDETYAANFVYKAQQQDPVLQRTLAGVKFSYDARADPNTHQVNLVIHLAR